MGLSSYRERRDCPRARVREENVDVTMFLFHRDIEPVQISQARYVTRDHRDISPDKGCGLLQLFLSSPSDHDVRTFFHEALGGGQANPAASACDNRNFSRQSLSMICSRIAHRPFSFCSLKLRFNAWPSVYPAHAEAADHRLVPALEFPEAREGPIAALTGIPALLPAKRPSGGMVRHRLGCPEASGPRLMAHRLVAHLFRSSCRGFRHFRLHVPHSQEIRERRVGTA